MKSNRFTVLAASALAFLSLTGAHAEPTLEAALADALTSMKTVYQSTYAPSEWKKKTFGWDVDAEFTRAMSRARSPGMTPAEARETLKQFVYSTRDYHVSMSFVSTELAELPFTVRGAEGRFFIAYINRDKLSEASFPFAVGDEVVTFDGKPTEQAVLAVEKQITANVRETDRALAEIYLTRRRASRGYAVPQGAVWVGIQRQGEKVVENRQLVWDYTPEKIRPFGASLLGKASARGSTAFERLFNRDMSVEDAVAAADNPFGLGMKKSYLPDMGKKIWETDAKNPFYAYISLMGDRKLIGYVRIPNYTPADADQAIASMREIVAKMEETTDALVIDQLNNPGGSVFYLYTLVSLFGDQPMTTPRHRMSITPADVRDALTTLDELAAVKDDATAKTAIGDTFGGYPTSYQMAQFMRSYANFIVSQWNAGKSMSDPYWIAGVDAINPSEKPYTKPILLLVNELDFSGGDFFPATLQDNKRATIMGVRTAGAGGYVNDMSFPNLLGIDSFRVTQSIAERKSLDPIENLGVTPDLAYSLTAEDFQKGFQPYADKISETILKMAK